VIRGFEKIQETNGIYDSIPKTFTPHERSRIIAGVIAVAIRA
jgi:hypothetical protein